MPFPFNSIGVSADRPQYTPIPDGVYNVKIGDAKEAVSKKTGYNMIELTVVIIEDEILEGKTLKYWVVFIPAGQKGDGMNVHFRKCIGVPYGGEDTVDASAWFGKKFRAKIGHETKEGKTFNKITNIEPYGGEFPPISLPEEEILF